MKEERLDSIVKCQHIFPNSGSHLILELVNEVLSLRKLINAIDTDYGGSVFCKDVDDQDWFDARNEILFGDE
jgi:hypothetical protein